MKKSILIFVFSCLIINILQAQKPFDEATFNEMTARWTKEPVSFFKNECDANFMFTNGNGESYNQEQAVVMYTNVIATATKKVENLKVWQTGNTGIATGKTIESYVFKNGKTSAYNGIFTYTFSQQNGKWVMSAAQHTDFKKPVFTAATLDELINEYKKDSKAFFNNRLSEDWRYINLKGGFQYQKAFLGGTAQNIVSTEMPEAVIFQSGDLAVTSGIHKTVRIGKDGNQITENNAVTYTWQRRNDKWMFVGSQQNNIQAPVADDEEAVKKAIEASTAYMYAADYDAYKKTWVNAPYITRVSVDAAGQVSRMNSEEYNALLEDYRKNYKTPNGIKITRSNFAIRINGTSAFVVFNQHNDNTDGTQRDSIEERYLEKVNGEWKIVNVTVIPKK